MKLMMFVLAAFLLVGCRSSESKYNTGGAPADSYNTPSTAKTTNSADRLHNPQTGQYQ